jgi:tRNA (adenine57-N1/adenine58-N1)-methyltransferase catalytic subunit
MPAEPDIETGAPAPGEVWSGVRRGPMDVGDWVRLTDPKGRKHNILLEAGKRFFTSKGSIAHDAMIGRPEGIVVQSSGGTDYLVFRPLLNEYVVSMKRGAAVVYPKDAAQIIAMADIFPGATVVEAGAGSGSLTSALLRAVGERGVVWSYERRADFADIARANVDTFFGGAHPSWRLSVGDLTEALAAGEPGQVDRVVLDMLAPWECIDAVGDALVPGGLVCAYVATTPQLSRVVETLRFHGEFTEPHAFETLVRSWHVEGLAVRPDHKMNGHTGFLVTARRMAHGVQAPARRRRPAPGAYGSDYAGPRPGRAAERDPEQRPGRRLADRSAGQKDRTVADSDTDG